MTTLTLLLLACGTPDDPTDVGPSPIDTADTAVSTTPDDTGDTAVHATDLNPEVLATGSLVVGEESTDYELVRLTREDGAYTYVQWIRPLPGDSAEGSVLVQTQPYDGISWTGDPVDDAFTSASPGATGLYADSACADVNDRGVVYYPVLPESAAAATVLHLLNGHGALLVYGRFYACDDIDGEVLDVRAALSFLASRPEEVDLDRIGITGNSWGGFLALWGAVREPVGIDVAVVAPINPPSDMARFLEGIAEQQVNFPDGPADFFDAYLHRIDAAVDLSQGGGDFSAWDVDDLCAGLAGKHALFLHDTWDTLVPFEGSKDVVDTCGGDVEGLWWTRPLPTDLDAVGLEHGLLSREPGYPSVYTMTYGYLYAQLNRPDRPVINLANRDALASFLQLVHDEQARGGDVDHARVRVLEAMDPAGLMILLEADGSDGGVDLTENVWTQAVNTVWGTSLDAAGLRAQLATGFPAPD